LLEAALVVNIHSPGTEEEDCGDQLAGMSLSKANDAGGEIFETEINGRSFQVFSYLEGAMGEFRELRVYKTKVNNTCYQLTQLLHYQNPESINEGSIVFIESQKVFSRLDKVRDTFLIQEITHSLPEQKTPELADADYIEKAIDGVGDEHVYGLDVSHWQGDIGWQKVANAGYDFTFVKGTEGNSWTDSMFHINMAEGNNAGVYLGVYHFARPDLGNTGAEEAEHFLDVAGDYLKSGYLKPVLDLERRGTLGEAALSNWVLEWMQTVENRTGIQPLIYTNLNYINNYLTNEVTQYDLWIAYWSCEPTPTYYLPPTGDWRDWDFWQYYGPGGCGPNPGYVPGIDTNIDLNIFNGVVAGLGDFDAASQLWVSLKSDTYQAPTPYYADITANVNGDEQGPINFAFWWDCSSLETAYDSVSAECGVLDIPEEDGNCSENDNGYYCKQVDSEVVTAENTYAEINNYTAKVVVERGSSNPAEDRYKITTHNPITGIRLYPDSPGDGKFNTPYDLYTRTFLMTSVEGAYSLEVKDPSTGEILGIGCREVPADSYLEELFNFQLLSSQTGSVSYELWSRYRSRSSCPIEDEIADDRVWNYEIEWGLPEFDIRRIDGSILLNGETDFQGEIRAFQESTVLYVVKNNSTITPLNIYDLSIQNLSNASIIQITENVIIDPLEEALIGITYQVSETGPYLFDLVISHNDDEYNPYKIIVLGDGISPFVDIGMDFWAYDAIEFLRHQGITSGCSTDPVLKFCPHEPVIRAEMAVFLEKVSQGIDFSPEESLPAFNDIEGHWAEYWITKLAQDGMTSGCAPEYFCPEKLTSRAEMAVFLLKLKYGAGYTPPEAQGNILSDVPVDYWAAAWIEKLVADGISSGCGEGKFCPNRSITRAEMAVLLNKTILQMSQP
jgi:lysozyme